MSTSPIRSAGSRAGLTLAALIGLAACGGKPPKVEPPPPAAPPPVLHLEATAASGANRGPEGQGLPIVVRIYELKANGAFSGADFFSLYDREAATLGAELVAREELTLAPGQKRSIDKPLDPQVRWVGVLGAFREIDRASWRASAPVAAGKDNAFAVSVGADAIRVAPR